jgi:hypothetical protein
VNILEVITHRMHFAHRHRHSRGIRSNFIDNKAPIDVESIEDTIYFLNILFG